MDHLPTNGAKRIVTPSPRLQFRVVNKRGQHALQQRNLIAQPVKVHRPRIIVGRIKAGTTVVDRAKGQRWTSREGRYRRIQWHRQPHSPQTLAGKVLLQAIDQHPLAPQRRVFVRRYQLQQPLGNRRREQGDAIRLFRPKRPESRAMRRQIQPHQKARLQRTEPPQKRSLLHLVLPLPCSC